jgi:hypothetical protein
MKVRVNKAKNNIFRYIDNFSKNHMTTVYYLQVVRQVNAFCPQACSRSRVMSKRQSTPLQAP